MKIYTKTGDKGQTSLYGGKRVSKSSLQIESYGTLDELNVYVGLLRSQEGIGDQEEILKAIQNMLFNIGSHLASDLNKVKLKKPQLLASDIELLEVQIDSMESTLKPLKNFILPGGNNASSFAHLARVICRKSERLMVALIENEETKNLVQDIMLQYINRLSDYFFVLSRFIIHNTNGKEFIWVSRK